MLLDINFYNKITPIIFSIKGAIFIITSKNNFIFTNIYYSWHMFLLLKL